MFWVIVIVGIIVWIVASAASKKSKAAALLTSMGTMMGNEHRFREYWAFMHQELLGTPIAPDRERLVVQRYLREHLMMTDQMKTLNADNVKVMLPALMTQIEALETKIAADIGPEFVQAKSRRRRYDKASEKYTTNILGLKF